jgi:hypothetical protein
VLTGDEVAAVLDVDALIDALAPAMADLSAGRASVPDRIGALVPPSGLSAADVETATGLQRPNVHELLQRLTELSHVERVPEERPTRWRRPTRTVSAGH